MYGKLWILTSALLGLLKYNINTCIFLWDRRKKGREGSKEANYKQCMDTLCGR